MALAQGHTADGSGEFEAEVYWQGRKGELKEVEKVGLSVGNKRRGCNVRASAGESKRWEIAGLICLGSFEDYQQILSQYLIPSF